MSINSYVIELSWYPVRGDCFKKARFRLYVRNAKRAYKIAKEIIVRHDKRLKEFEVCIMKNSIITHYWVKKNGVIKRTR